MTQTEYSRLPQVSRQQVQIMAWLRDAAFARSIGNIKQAKWNLQNVRRMLQNRRLWKMAILPA